MRFGEVWRDPNDWCVMYIGEEERAWRGPSTVWWSLSEPPVMPDYYKDKPFVWAVKAIWGERLDHDDED